MPGSVYSLLSIDWTSQSFTQLFTSTLHNLEVRPGKLDYLFLIHKNLDSCVGGWSFFHYSSSKEMPQFRFFGLKLEKLKQK